MEIEGFDIRRTIGKGGMATVYLATQESLGRAVVLKTMRTDSGSMERFLNEGRIVARLRHPHIVTIYDIGSAEDLLYLAMEYVEGGDLKGRIDGPLPPDYALELVEKIGTALELAHQEGVIHRDVKPANILFRGDGTPLLSDFGIAKQMQADAELTSTGMILGSPFYMSPEQAEGRPVDPRTDIYSLGVIFYEMLTGNRPYVGDSQIKVIMKHLQAPIPSLPLPLQRYQPLLERMIAKRRIDRFADASALVDAVRAARAESPPAPVASTSPPNPATSPIRIDVAPEPAAAKPRRRRRLRGPTAAGILAGLAAVAAGFYFYVEALKVPELVATRPAAPAAAAPPSNVQAPEPAPGAAAVSSPSVPGEASDSASGDSEPMREDVVRALEWLAANSLRDDRLTDPPGDNALYYLDRLRALDPGNQSGSKGLALVAERYVVLAEKQFAAKNYERSLSYIDRGLMVDPNNEGLQTLRELIDGRETSLLDSVIAFFKS